MGILLKIHVNTCYLCTQVMYSGTFSSDVQQLAAMRLTGAVYYVRCGDETKWGCACSADREIRPRGYGT